MKVLKIMNYIVRIVMTGTLSPLFPCSPWVQCCRDGLYSQGAGSERESFVNFTKINCSSIPACGIFKDFEAREL